MAFELKVAKGNIEVILFQDSAVTCTRDEYNDYLQSFERDDGPSEEILKLTDRKKATKFVLRRTLPFDRKQALRSKNIRVKQNDIELDANYSSDLIRAALVDIVNPDDVPDTKAIRFKRDKDGLVSSELVNALDDAKVLPDLIAAYSAATSGGDDEQLKN